MLICSLFMVPHRGSFNDLCLTPFTSHFSCWLMSFHLYGIFKHSTAHEEIFPLCFAVTLTLWMLCAPQAPRGDQGLLRVHLPTTGGGEDETGGGGPHQGSHSRPVAQCRGRTPGDVEMKACLASAG